MHIIHYPNDRLHSRAVDALRIWGGEFDIMPRRICIDQQQLEDLIKLGHIPPDELQRLREAGTLPPSNGEMFT